MGDGHEHGRTVSGRSAGPATPDQLTLNRISRFYEPLDDIDLSRAFEHTVGGVAEALLSAMEASLATVWIPNPTTEHLRLAYSTYQGSGDLPEDLPFAESRSGRAVRTAEAHFYPTLEAEIPCAHAELLRALRLTEMWCLPLVAHSLRVEHGVVAVATVHFKEGSDSGCLGNWFARFCGARAGRAIERALWAEQDAVVQQVYHAMGGIDQGLWTVMDNVATKIALRLHFSACTILLSDQTLHGLRIIGTTGVVSNLPREQWVYETGEGPPGHVASSNELVASENIDVEDWNSGPARFAERVDEGKARQFLGAPVRSPDGRLLGVVQLCNKQQHRGAPWARRLNHLDWLRIERVARVMAPLLSLIAEKVHQDTVLKRIRHDQKAPANMIRNFASYYARMPRERLVKDLGALYQGLEDCESLADLITINANLTRIDVVSGIELHPEKCYLLAGFVAKVCKMFRRVCHKQGLQGPYRDDDFHAIPKLHVDPVLLQIALYNLLDNAVKYAHPGTEVRLASEHATDSRGARYRIHVKNWGIGIPAGHVERVFERQFRTVEARERSVTGLGLGLTIARAIVERHGGTLKVTNLTNPTQLTIDLPGTLAMRAPR